ncbi:hypothetical protein P8C59_001411 [Phyllachora maydis]|uniref:Uncharacterized protein n=1 Tax=Phyllachora maydis TaxID=1825666 RepID=A0AAD9M925_9PEZI|nr:hypothetical protein P8C59_001411 [Phyllachora maydis]
MPAKLAKITLAIYYAAARKAKRRELAKAYATAGRAAAAKRPKKEDLQRSKCTAGGDAGRYTTNSGLIADKDDDNAYNRAYMPSTEVEEEEEDSSSNNDSINSGTSDSTNKGKGSSMYERGKGALHCKDILLYKRYSILARPIVARYLKVLIAFKPASTVYVISKGPINEDEELSYSKI